MDNGAKGVEVVISGKVKGGRAKGMKFRDGYMLKTGDVTHYYVDKAVTHVNLRQGVLGICVRIMLPFDPTGESGGATIPQPDVVTVREPEKVEPVFDDKKEGQHN